MNVIIIIREVIKIKKRILLLAPPLDRHIIWDPFRTSQPLGLGYLGSALKENGHDVKLLDCASKGFNNRRLLGKIPKAFVGRSFYEIWSSIQNDFNCLSPHEFRLKYLDISDNCFWRVGLSEEEVVEYIRNFKPDLICISCVASVNHKSMMDLVSEIRKQYDNVPIIAGGSHVTALPETVLRDGNEAIDFVVCGEGEFLINEIVKNINNKNIMKKLPGIAFLDESGDFHFNPRAKQRDLNDYPLLDPTIFDFNDYPSPATHVWPTKKRYIDVIFSRGCHNRCAFCFTDNMWGRFRKLTLKNVDLQLSLLRENGYEELILMDDSLVEDKYYTIEVLKRIKKFGFAWQNDGGIEIEMVDKELAGVMSSTKCKFLYIPMNPRTMSTSLPSEKVKERTWVLKLFKDNGIYTTTSGIYGASRLEYPEVIQREIDELLAFHISLVQKNIVDCSMVFFISALPGTRWNKMVINTPGFKMKEGINPWLFYSIYTPQIYTSTYPYERLFESAIRVHQELSKHQTTYSWAGPFINTVQSDKKAS